jgi:hypothetical protein
MGKYSHQIAIVSWALKHEVDFTLGRHLTTEAESYH